MEPAGTEQELERLQAQLSARRSIVHYAHAAVAVLAALILASAFVKLYVDQDRLVGWGNSTYRATGHGLLLAGGASLLYAAVRAVLGRRWMRREAEQYARLLTLRKTLKLDDPSALLPR